MNTDMENAEPSGLGDEEDWVQNKLASLRQQVEQSELWDRVDSQLWEHLCGSVSDKDDDIAILSTAVSDALKGTDLAQHHPAFFSKLLANPELQQKFLDLLDRLDETKDK